ncbi:GerW family sporulation protein [Methanosphaera sp. WGK6]|uniref:GerW family sporulation protein n=1 Tax=Methanosphaera sp. WGK6 TaxID=1561964 RepID=UPI00084C0113|nr:spore germination protein GerW family protein [Methanosphaera sp. WGK6]
MDLDSSLDKTLTQIQNVMNANSIIGDPITTKDKTIIPISKVALGFGIGLGKNEGKTETEMGGAGGGGSIDPVAFVVIHHNIPGPNGVEILPIEGTGTPLGDLLVDVGKVIFDLIGNQGMGMSGEEVPEENTNSIDKIKTKVKSTKKE